MHTVCSRLPSNRRLHNVTLPIYSIVHPNEIAFPAPPAFDPPPPASMKPIFIPANDSDYDEVASSDEETPNLTSMVSQLRKFYRSLHH